MAVVGPTLTRFYLVAVAAAMLAFGQGVLRSPRKEPRPETRQAAREAVDPERAEEVLDRADEELQPTPQAAEALQEAAAEETAEIAEEAADLARRRASDTIEPDDVAKANERHQEREERPPKTR